MKPTSILFVALASSLAVMPSAFAEQNKIAPMIDSVQVMHNGKPVTVQRGHDPQAHLPDAYQKTERGCPPFCVQPMTAVPGVDTTILDPRSTWADKDEYDATAAKLVQLFVDNFAQFEDHVDESVKQAAPAA